MKIRDLCDINTCELRITFDEDPYQGEVDVIIPVTAEPKEILGDSILDTEIRLMGAEGDAIIVSTGTR